MFGVWYCLVIKTVMFVDIFFQTIEKSKLDPNCCLINCCIIIATLILANIPDYREDHVESKHELYMNKDVTNNPDLKENC